MRAITTDVNGIIRELGLGETDILVPLFECVVNSIQAIEELGSEDKKNGDISISIVRDEKQQRLFEGCLDYPIQSVTIQDNGIGFTDSNIESFYQAYSSKKREIGGKGIGRFSMLSLYKSVKVKSIISSSGTSKLRRFELSRQGVTTEDDVETSELRRTTVRLDSLLEKYQKASAKYKLEDVADGILEHCLLYFLGGNAPTIIIDEKDKRINLKNQFSPRDFVIASKEKVIKGQNFIFHFVKNGKKAHSVCYCANNRKVQSRKLSKVLPIFTSPINWRGEEAFFDVYIVSDYFDNIVNPSRTDLRFPKESDEVEFPELSNDKITEKEILAAAVDIVKEVYSKEIQDRRGAVEAYVQQYLSKDEGIGYRHLNLDNSFFDKVPDNISDKKLDEMLHEEDYNHSCGTRKKLDVLLARDYSTSEDYQKLLKEYINVAAEEGMSKLAQYVSHRKTVIDLLEKCLQWISESEEYEPEETLHNLIYTMGGNQDTIEYDKHNLWLLDDRLTFHRYIYSDKQIKSHEPVEGISDCRKETDIAIYDTAFAYGEKNDYQEVQSVVVFELKRPNREITYEDFSKQMLDQISGIQSGAKKDNNGKNIAFREHTPVTFYFVCDVNAFEKLKARAELEGFNMTPYRSLMRLVKDCHQEILTYDTLLVNAKRRNAIFFKKLGIQK